MVDFPHPTGPTIMVRLERCTTMLNGPTDTGSFSLQPAVRSSAKITVLLMMLLFSADSSDNLAIEVTSTAADLQPTISAPISRDFSGLEDSDKPVEDCGKLRSRLSCLDVVCRKVLILSIDPIAVATPADASTKVEIGVARSVKSVNDVNALLEVNPPPLFALSMTAQIVKEMTGDIDTFVYAEIDDQQYSYSSRV